MSEVSTSSSLRGKVLQREIHSVILNDTDEEEHWAAAKETNVTTGVIFIKKQTQSYHIIVISPKFIWTVLSSMPFTSSLRVKLYSPFKTQIKTALYMKHPQYPQKSFGASF